MHKIKIFCSWNLDIDLVHEKQIELYVDRIPESPNNEVIRIIFLLEPPTFLDLTDKISVFYNNFNFILTYNENILRIFSKKARMFEHGMSWVKDYEFPEKEFSISTVVGFKIISEGHHLRHGIWYKQDKIINPKKFYLSSEHDGVENIYNNQVLGEKKDPLFDSQFNICIESTKINNYFTEKLIDCLITKTIPIYYGCPNIGNWFNLKGFFIVNNIKDIIDTSNSLTEHTYDTLLEYVEENYEKAKIFSEYKSVSERIKHKILSLI